MEAPATARRRLAQNDRQVARGKEMHRRIFDAAEKLDMTVDWKTVPPVPRLFTKFSVLCGCTKNTLSMTLTELERLNRVVKERGIEGPYCGKCRAEAPRRKLAELVEARGGTIVRPMTSFESPMEVKCSNPLHPAFEAYPGGILYQGTWCKMCAYEARGSKAEEKIAEAAATMGCRLVQYVDAKTPAVFEHADGTFECRTSNLAATAPVTDNTVSVALNGNRAFVFVGTPSNLPEELSAHVAAASTFVMDVALTKRAAVTYMERLIKDLASGADVVGLPQIESPEVLNVWRNPQWKSPGKFTWGEMRRYA